MASTGLRVVTLGAEVAVGRLGAGEARRGVGMHAVGVEIIVEFHGIVGSVPPGGVLRILAAAEGRVGVVVTVLKELGILREGHGLTRATRAHARLTLAARHL